MCILSWEIVITFKELSFDEIIAYNKPNERWINLNGAVHCSLIIRVTHGSASLLEICNEEEVEPIVVLKAIIKGLDIVI